MVNVHDFFTPNSFLPSSVPETLPYPQSALIKGASPSRKFFYVLAWGLAPTVEVKKPPLPLRFGAVTLKYYIIIIIVSLKYYIIMLYSAAGAGVGCSKAGERHDLVV
jgi:hypothetical protein